MSLFHSVSPNGITVAVFVYYDFDILKHKSCLQVKHGCIKRKNKFVG